MAVTANNPNQVRASIRVDLSLCVICIARVKAMTMPAQILPLTEAASLWPDRGPLIGLDLGTKTIGVAVSDPDRRLASGPETVKRKAFKAAAARLMAIAAER